MSLRSGTNRGEREIGMSAKHREEILENIDLLVKNTNYNRLANECVKIGLISREMLRNIEDLNEEGHNLNKEDVLLLKHKRLFIKITKRGPCAKSMLLQALRTVGSMQAVEILEDTDHRPNQQPFISIATMNNNRNSIDTGDNSTMPASKTAAEGACVSMAKYNDISAPVTPYLEPVVGQTRVVTKSDCIQEDKILGTYKMQSKENRGVLLMVNIIDFRDPNKRRNGAEIDGDSLIHIFREMGFTIFAYKNITQEEFFDILSKVISSSYVQETECFVMVLMTHGERVGEVDKVEFCDGSVADVIRIKNHFRATASPYLVHKPKVLIFPFCRGKKSDRGHSVPIVETDGNGSVSVPTLSDMLVSYASTPGFQAHRDRDKGSWYIQKFCDIMAEYAHNTHVEDILKQTHSAVDKMRTKAGFRQTGSYDNIGFNKKLYFNPGFYVVQKE